MQQQIDKIPVPFLHLFRNYWGKVLQGISFSCLQAAVICLLFLYLPTYLVSILHYPKSAINLLNTANIVLFSFAIIFAGFISDFVGRRVVFLIGAIGLSIFGYSLFYLLSLDNLAYVIFVMITFSLVSSCVTGVCACAIAELFPTEVRYSGMAFSFNVGLAIFGGVAPIFATYLIKITHNVIAPSYYLIFCALVCLVGLISLKSMHKKILK